MKRDGVDIVEMFESVDGCEPGIATFILMMCMYFLASVCLRGAHRMRK